MKGGVKRVLSERRTRCHNCSNGNNGMNVRTILPLRQSRCYTLHTKVSDAAQQPDKNLAFSQFCVVNYLSSFCNQTSSWSCDVCGRLLWFVLCVAALICLVLILLSTSVLEWKCSSLPGYHMFNRQCQSGAECCSWSLTI